MENTIICSYFIISSACFQSFFILLEISNTSVLKLVQNTMKNIKYNRWPLIRTNKTKKIATILEIKVWRAKQAKAFVKLYVGALSRSHIHSSLQKFTTWDKGQSQGVYSVLPCLCRNSTVDTYFFSISLVAGYRITLERKSVKVRDLLSTDGGEGEGRLVITGSMDAH